MKYIGGKDIDKLVMFRCENFGVCSNGYEFENIVMDNFNIGYFEVNSEDIALINIK